MTKLQYSLTAKNRAVNSWDLSDNPAPHKEYTKIKQNGISSFHATTQANKINQTMPLMIQWERSEPNNNLMP